MIDNLCTFRKSDMVCGSNKLYKNIHLQGNTDVSENVVHDWEFSTAITYYTTGGQHYLHNVHLASNLQAFALLILKQLPSVVYVVYISVGKIDCIDCFWCVFKMFSPSKIDGDWWWWLEMTESSASRSRLHPETTVQQSVDEDGNY